ncbi:hypothetical protein GCM10027047_36700 [Rhodococcus aerolatus]
MKRLVATGISIGVLAGLFTWGAFNLTAVGSFKAPLVVWVGFAAWACFFAVGGGTSGLVKTAACTVSGLVWGYLIVKVWLAVAPTSLALLGLLVGVGAFGMCVQARVPVLSFIPASFIGASAYFGYGAATNLMLVKGAVFNGEANFSSPSLFWGLLVSLVGGSVLAWLSERGADVVERALGGGTPAVAAEAAPQRATESA